MRLIWSIMLLISALVIAARFSASQPRDGTVADWPAYGGDAGGSRYSPLAEIDRTNVARLQVTWEYHTGDVSDGSDGRRKSAFETTPIVARGTMYFSTPFNRVIALDPETGKEKWSFDPKIDLRAPYSEGLINRGVTLWTDPAKGDGEACARRIFLATIDARLLRSTRRAAGPAATSARADKSTSGREFPISRAAANMRRRPSRRMEASAVFVAILRDARSPMQAGSSG